MAKFAAKVGISFHTFKHYACKDLSKRRKLGSSVGAKPLVPQEDQRFIVDLMQRHDRGNDPRRAPS